MKRTRDSGFIANDSDEEFMYNSMFNRTPSQKYNSMFNTISLDSPQPPPTSDDPTQPPPTKKGFFPNMADNIAGMFASFNEQTIETGGSTHDGVLNSMWNIAKQYGLPLVLGTVGTLIGGPLGGVMGNIGAKVMSGSTSSSSSILGGVGGAATDILKTSIKTLGSAAPGILETFLTNGIQLISLVGNGASSVLRTLGTVASGTVQMCSDFSRWAREHPMHVRETKNKIIALTSKMMNELEASFEDQMRRKEKVEEGYSESADRFDEDRVYTRFVDEVTKRWYKYLWAFVDNSTKPEDLKKLFNDIFTVPIPQSAGRVNKLTVSFYRALKEDTEEYMETLIAYDKTNTKWQNFKRTLQYYHNFANPIQRWISDAFYPFPINDFRYRMFEHIIEPYRISINDTLKATKTLVTNPVSRIASEEMSKSADSRRVERRTLSRVLKSWFGYGKTSKTSKTSKKRKTTKKRKTPKMTKKDIKKLLTMI